MLDTLCINKWGGGFVKCWMVYEMTKVGGGGGVCEVLDAWNV